MRAIPFLAFAGVLFGILGSDPAFADHPAPTQVGRLSLVEGHVGYRPAGGEWSDGVVNLPVAAGMSLRTDGQARAEFRLGDRRVALAPETELSLAIVDGRTTELAIKRGRIGLELRRVDSNETVQIDIPSGGVWLAKPGHYEIVAGSGNEPPIVAAFDGAARFVGGGADCAIAANTAATLEGKPVAPKLAEAAADGFTGWWRGAGADDRSISAMLHVAPEMTGIEAFDGNGHWEAVSGQGSVWFAEGLPENWAPYRDGAWRWVQPWGWTWIDDRPWGFATSHYGRWARLADANGGERWGWAPGAPVDRPAYAPALVGFLGTAGVGLSYPDGFGPAIAWYPLAPGEVYWPGFTRDIAAIRRLNAGAVVDPAAIRVEDGNPGAEVIGAPGQNRGFASAIPRSVFTAGKSVEAALVDIPRPRLQEAPMIIASMQFPPPPLPPSSPLAHLGGPASSPLRIVAAAAIARLSSPAKSGATGSLPVLARTLIVRPAVKVAGVRSVGRPGRPIVRPPFLIAAQRLAEARRQHLAAARGLGR